MVRYLLPWHSRSRVPVAGALGRQILYGQHFWLFFPSKDFHISLCSEFCLCLYEVEFKSDAYTVIYSMPMQLCARKIASLQNF